MKSKKSKRTLSIIVCFAILLIMCLCVCISPGKRGRVLDANGTPIANAYVIYGYSGTECHIVDADVYYRPGTVIQTDENGYFRIPAAIRIRDPLFQSPFLYPQIFVVYDPRTHCAGTLPSKMWLKRYEPYKIGDTLYKQDGAEEFKTLHWWFETKTIDGTETLVFHDVTNDPFEWYRSIKQLSEAFKYCDRDGFNGWRAPIEKRRLLSQHLIQEYKNLGNRHGQQECQQKNTLEKLRIPDRYQVLQDVITDDLQFLRDFREKVIMN